MSRTTGKRVEKSTETKNMNDDEGSSSQQHESDERKDTKDSESSADDSDKELEVDLDTVSKSQDNRLKHILLSVAVFGGVCAIAYMFYIVNLNENEGDKIIYSVADVDKIWESGLQELQLSFTGQTHRFWKILKNRGLAHLRTKQPKQPLVFLMAAVPEAHDEVDCLATKLAELLDPAQKNNLTKINGRELQNKPGGEAKKIMDDNLCGTFKKGRKVAIVYHLHLLPPPSPILFYSYCDDQNAPYKHIAMVFTVHLPRAPDPSLSPVEAAGSVEKFLQQEVWADSPYNQDEIAALLSRIADTVLLMNSSGKNKSLKNICEG